MKIKAVNFTAIADNFATLLTKDAQFAFDLDKLVRNLPDHFLLGNPKTVNGDDVLKFQIALTKALADHDTPMVLSEFPTDAEAFEEIENIPFIVTLVDLDATQVVDFDSQLTAEAYNELNHLLGQCRDEVGKKPTFANTIACVTIYEKLYPEHDLSVSELIQKATKAEVHPSVLELIESLR